MEQLHSVMVVTLRDMSGAPTMSQIQTDIAHLKQVVSSKPAEPTQAMAERSVQTAIANLDLVPALQTLSLKMDDIHERALILSESIGGESLPDSLTSLDRHLREALPQNIQDAMHRVREEVLAELQSLPTMVELKRFQGELDNIKQFIDSHLAQQTKAIVQAGVRDTLISVQALPELKSIDKIVRYVSDDPMTKVEGFVDKGAAKTVREVSQLPSLETIPDIRSKLDAVEESVTTTFPKLKADYQNIRMQIDQLKARNKAAHYTVLFDFDSDQVTQSGYQAIQRFVEEEVNPSKRIWLYGFADRVGGIEYNEHLSLRRATAVKRVLLALGISEAQIIKVEARGEERTAVPTADDEREPSNRRVTLIARSRDGS